MGIIKREEEMSKQDSIKWLLGWGTWVGKVVGAVSWVVDSWDPFPRLYIHDVQRHIYCNEKNGYFDKSNT